MLPSENDVDGCAFDHHSTEFVQNSWSIYEQLRSRDSIYHTSAYGGFWVVSRYEDVKRIALDPSTFSSVSLLIPSFNSYRMLPINADPPEHAKYRRILNPYFSTRAVQAEEPAIGAETTRRIDSFISRGECELMTELAQPIAAMRTFQLVGLPEDRWDTYATVVHQHDSTRFDDPGHLAAQAQLVTLREELAEVITDRMANPREDDLVTHLLRAQVDGQPLASGEVADILLFLIMAGIDNTKAAIGNAVLHLHHDRATRRRLMSDPGLIPNAVEELLRYETPVPALARTATRDCVVGGQSIRKGEKLMLLWASANRDEAVFPDADHVDVDRGPGHIAFGIGAHHCLGAPLARAELRIVLREVLRRLPDYDVMEEGVEDLQTIGLLYGKRRLPITFTPGSPEGDD